MEIKLVWLLRAAWVAGTLPILIASLPISKLSSFHGVVLGFARRGKTMQLSSRMWLLRAFPLMLTIYFFCVIFEVQKFTVPQKFFCHFYVIAVVWTTLLLGTTWIYAYSMTLSSSEKFRFSDLASYLTGSSRTFPFHKSHLPPLENQLWAWNSVFLLLLMECQVLRRLIESIYVFKYSPSARMHIFGYLTGLFFYTAAPLSLCCTIIPKVATFAGIQVTEFIAKSKSQMSDFKVDWWEFISPLMKLGLTQWIAAAIFLWGSIHQRHCHAILGSLREQASSTDEYVIPHGDWFEIVSCPHYLAEIVIYGSMVVGSGGSDLTIWLLFGFVIANLSLAAAETHRWYLRKFENYPRARCALIPFIY